MLTKKRRVIDNRITKCPVCNIEVEKIGHGYICSKCKFMWQNDTSSKIVMKMSRIHILMDIKAKDSEKFSDMKRRVFNSCTEINYHNPGDYFLYGPLYLYDKKATLGDLTIPVSTEQTERLITIYRGRKI